MAEFNVDALSLGELLRLNKSVSKAISNYDGRQKAYARQKLEAIAKSMGYSILDLFVKPDRAIAAPAVPKFRHPQDGNLTWSGRGRTPRWFIQAIMAGMTTEDLTVESEE